MKKKILFYTLLIAACNTSAQVKWGVTSSLGLNRITGYKDANVNTGVLLTVQGAVFSEMPLGKSSTYALMPSLGYFPKGVAFPGVTFTDNLGNELGTGKQVRRINYLQLNIPVCLKMQWGKSANGYVGLGPYFAYALSGVDKYKGFPAVLNGSQVPASVKVDFNQAHLNRFDAGIHLLLSAIISKHLYIGLASDMGITKLNTAGTVNLHNQASHVFAGYVF